MPESDDLTLETLLHTALELDQDERDYLASLNMAATWRSQSAQTADPRWGWLALIGVVAAFLAWSVASQLFGDVLNTANEVGLSTVVLNTAIQLALSFGQALIEVSTNPALGLMQPLLAVLALALLFWPRIVKFAPQISQGALS